MNESERMENKDMVDEVIAKLEALFEENPKYNMETLKKYLNRTGELTITLNRIKEEIQQANPGITHEELIEQASAKVAEMVQMQEMESQQQEVLNGER